MASLCVTHCAQEVTGVTGGGLGLLSVQSLTELRLDGWVRGLEIWNLNYSPGCDAVRQGCVKG